MAHVNIKTKKIYGAKKGTLTYGHELGHLAFSKTIKGEMIRLKEELSKDFLNVSFLGAFWFYNINPLLTKIVLSYFVFRWLYYYTYEEVWCWIYALNKTGGKLGSKNI